jgi:zinc protease
MKPAKAAFRAGCLALFGSHPYGSGEHGTVESLQTFTPEIARTFWEELFSTNSCIMGFAGDIDAETAAARAEYLDNAANWQQKKMILPEPPEFPAESKVIDLPIEREQTVVMKLLAIPPLRGETGILFHMLNMAENGMNSRLFQRVREDKGLAYSVGTKAAGGFHPGVFAFSAATQAEKIADVEECFDEEISRLASEGISEEEFNMARDAMLFRLARASESSHALVEFTMLDMFYGEPVNALEQLTQKLKACSVDRFNSVIRDSFTKPVTVTVHAGKLP